jgi:hypothetical protein
MSTIKMPACPFIKKAETGTQDAGVAIVTTRQDVEGVQLGIPLEEETLTTTMPMWKNRIQAVLMIIAPTLTPIPTCLATFIVWSR